MAYPQIWQTASAKSLQSLLLERLSFSHFAELLKLEEAIQLVLEQAERLSDEWKAT